MILRARNSPPHCTSCAVTSLLMVSRLYIGKKDQWLYQWVKGCWFYTPLTVTGSCVWTLQQESLLNVSSFLHDNCILLGNVSQTQSVSGRLFLTLWVWNFDEKLTRFFGLILSFKPCLQHVGAKMQIDLWHTGHYFTGAAVFFPDKEARREQLFSMMRNVEVHLQMFRLNCMLIW